MGVVWLEVAHQVVKHTRGGDFSTETLGVGNIMLTPPNDGKI